MKKFKSKLIYIIGLPLVIITSVVSVGLINNKENNLNSEFVYEFEESNYRSVYMLDDSNTLFPLTIKVNKGNHLIDEIYTVVSKLRDLEVKGFNSVLAKDIKINKIELKDGILNIDFSKEFLIYNKDLEEKIIEALTWSVLEFDEIKGLTISVEGDVLKSMPLNGLKLPEVLDKSIGINKYGERINKCLNCKEVVVVYSKRVGDRDYYVPITRYVESSSEVSIVDAYKKDVSVVSGFKKLNLIDDLKGIEKVDDEMNIRVDESYLVEENLVDSRVYELIVVTLYYNDLDYKVNFFVNDDAVMVNGYNNSEEKVSRVNINEIKI